MWSSSAWMGWRTIISMIPKAQLPVLRKLAAEGARAKRMLCSFPTVTWPNHTTLVTGVVPVKHGVISNGIFDRKTLKNVTYLCDPVYDMADLVKAPTIFDVAHEAGLKTAGVCWPATRHAKTLDWTIPDMLDQDAFEQYSTATLLTECRVEGIPYQMQGEWCKAGNAGKPQRDFMYTQLARHIILRQSPAFVAAPHERGRLPARHRTAVTRGLLCGE